MTLKSSVRAESPVVLVGLAVLAAVLGVAYYQQWYLTFGGRTECGRQLSAIIKGVQSYHVDYKNLPSALIPADDNGYSYSWRVAILNYIPLANYRNFLTRYRFDEPWNGPTNSQLPLPPRVVKNKGPIGNLYHCVFDTGPESQASYLAVIGRNTVFGDAIAFETLGEKAAASTIVLVESHHSGIHWMEPRDITVDEILKGINTGSAPAIGSQHPPAGTSKKGATVVFADGRGTWINEGIDKKVLESMLYVKKSDETAE